MSKKVRASYPENIYLSLNLRFPIKQLKLIDQAQEEHPMKLQELSIHNFRGIIDVHISLQNYSLIVGPNNAGKSTIFDSLRAFYEKDNFKFNQKDHFPLKGAYDEESWIELLFKLTDSEFHSLKEEYRLNDNQLKVRKYFLSSSKGKGVEGAIFAYDSNNKLSESPFYGAKNVQSGKFGDLIYIPAVSKVDDHTKLTGPSALRDLITNIMSNVVDSSDSYTKLHEDVSKFAEQITSIKTSDNLSLNGFEEDLNSLLQPWQTKFNLKFTPPSTTDIIKSMLSFDLQDIHHDKAHNIEYFGSGFQRHFIYSLINLKSKYAPLKISKKSKDFAPELTLLLFEEPEAFLHPPQQDYLARQLIELNDLDSWQIICSTHSPHFVSKSTDRIPAIIRTERKKGKVTTKQISNTDWQSLIDANQLITNIAQKYPKLKKTLQSDDQMPDMEAIKYFLWLNSDRSSIFFANFVLIVEGPSEVAILNKLVDDKKITLPNGTYILDSMGKFNIHRFISLLGYLGIKHSVMYDDDNHEDYHSDFNQLISDTKNSMTVRIQQIPKDIENYLNIPSPGSPHRKPQHILYLYSKNKIAQEKVSALCQLVNSCFIQDKEN